jgi:serpin B
LTAANTFWGQEQWPFRRSYKDLLAELYRAELFEVPFATNPEGSRQRINAWVSDQTQGKIPELLPLGSVTDLTRLVLASAIYFYGTWKYQFDPALTKSRDFYLLDGPRILVPMMEAPEIALRHSAGKLAGISYHAVELPYACNALSMVLLVPERGRFSPFEDALTANSFHSILGSMSERQVHLVMPRFTFGSSFELSQALAGLGMRSAFAPGADLSGMDETGELYFDRVYHQAVIALDEKGSEAAAATAVVIKVLGPPTPPEIVEIVVERPFVFLIRDLGTETILFLGRVVAPGDDHHALEPCTSPQARFVQ